MKPALQNPVVPAMENAHLIFDMIDKREHIETAARALKAISHPLRLKILCVIGAQEACVQEIVDSVGTCQSNISHWIHIRLVLMVPKYYFF